MYTHVYIYVYVYTYIYIYIYIDAYMFGCRPEGGLGLGYGQAKLRRKVLVL